MVCNFCDVSENRYRTLFENELAYVILSYRAVLKNHMIILPKRHVKSFFDLNHQEIIMLNELAKKAINLLKENGYINFIINTNEGFNKTMEHLHMHIKPSKKRGRIGEMYEEIREYNQVKLSKKQLREQAQSLKEKIK